MRTNFYLMITALLMCVSCQTNDDLENDNSAIENAITETNTRGMGGVVNNTTQTTQREAFESMLQWTAYLTAQALYHDADAEIEFMSILAEDISGPFKTTDIEKLLRPINGGGDFRKAFKTQFFIYVDIDCDDGGNNEGGFGPLQGSPKPVPPIEIIDPNSCSQTFDAFVSALIDHNCLEVYLPLGYDENNDNLMSTAHPLTGSMQNDCYIHPVDTNTTTIVKAGNLHTYNNPIMVRPVRIYGPIDDVCLYSEYAGVDFTIFLNN